MESVNNTANIVYMIDSGITFFTAFVIYIL